MPNLHFRQKRLRASPSDHAPFLLARAPIDFPKSNAAEIGISIMPELDTDWQLIEALGVTATENNVIGDERFLELQDGVFDLGLPRSRTKPSQPRFAQILLDYPAIAIREVA